ncbi:MAG TPA: hypothetical protein VG797_04635 [Phycisphaerales bacterium]|nr:hypothetical protein [Phycisphaerales bacterium]
MIVTGAIIAVSLSGGGLPQSQPSTLLVVQINTIPQFMRTPGDWSREPLPESITSHPAFLSPGSDSFPGVYTRTAMYYPEFDHTEIIARPYEKQHDLVTATPTHDLISSAANEFRATLLNLQRRLDPSP